MYQDLLNFLFAAAGVAEIGGVFDSTKVQKEQRTLVFATLMRKKRITNKRISKLVISTFKKNLDRLKRKKS